MSKIGEIMMRAEQAMQVGEWTRAQELYQQALDLDHNATQADRGLRLARQAVDKERQIQDDIAEVIAKLDEDDYQGARRQCVAIMERAAADPPILKFHMQLEELRNRANDLAIWNQRVQKTLQDTQRLGEQGNWTEAIQNVETTIADLPEGRAYTRLKQTLETSHDRASQQVDSATHYARAVELLNTKDFEGGIKHLQLVGRDSPDYNTALRLLRRAESEVEALKDALEHVEAAQQAREWANAIALLGQTEDQYGKFPAWQRLYLRCGISYGRELLESGRQLNDQNNFDQARHQFEAAQATLAEVLRLFPKHLEAQPLYNEATDLATIAGYEKQAQLEQETGRREIALHALRLAQQQVENAKREGRDYVAVGAKIKILTGALEEEIRRIREEERRLREGEGHWERNALRQARECFQETLQALLPEHRARAEEGLHQVEVKIAQFEQLLERGQAAPDPLSAVNDLQAAYDLWEDGPGVRAALEAALVKACETELGAGHETAAAGLGQRALALNPTNREAKLLVARAGMVPEITATQETVRGELATLKTRGRIESAALTPLVSKLEAALHKAEPWPDLRDQIAQQFQSLREQQGRWQKYEQHYQRAQTRRNAGEWEDACRAFDEALSVLEGAEPNEAREQRALWQVAADAVMHSRQEVAGALAQARENYGAIAQAETLAAVGNDFTITVQQLDSARKTLRMAEESVQAAGGILPTDIADLQRQIEALSKCADESNKAVRLPSAADGLIRIQEIIRIHGEDPSLAAVHVLLQKEAGKAIADLRIRAQSDIRVGEFEKALEKLSQVRQLDPADTETSQLYAELQQRKRLEEELMRVNRDATSKLASNSPGDAMKTLRDGIDLLLNPEVPLPPNVREILDWIIELSRREAGQAFGLPEHWNEAQSLLAKLGPMGSESWAARHAVTLVNQWITLARDDALQRVVASAIGMGHLLQAYRASAEYLNEHPQDRLAIDKLAERAEALFGQLNSSVEKRIGRAKGALEDGDYVIALGNLSSIETEFYAPIDTEFPDLLAGIPEVQNLREEIEKLRISAQKIQTLTEKVLPGIETAEKAYLDSQWDAAELALRALPELKEAPALSARVATLHERIAQGRVDSARKHLHEILNRVEAGSRAATTIKMLEDYLRELEAVPAKINLQLLDVEERQPYYQILHELREQRELLGAGILWEQKIDEHFAAQDYEAALEAVDEALAATRQGEKRVALQTRRREIERLTQVQRERTRLLQEGKDHFTREDYVGAQQLLKKARELGEDVKELLDAAQAGALLQSARKMWEAGDSGNALLDLEELENSVKENAWSSDIATEARRLRQRIQKAREENSGKVLELLEQARAATTRQSALQLVEMALELAPGNVEARLLQKQIQSAANADQVVVQVEFMIQSGQFKAARERLTEMAKQGGVAPEKLRDLQELIRTQEAEQWNRVIQPIQHLYREAQFSEALNRCKQALQQTATPELLQELQNLQVMIVGRWVETRVQALRKELQGHPAEDKLREFEGQVIALQKLDPSPDAYGLRQLRDLLKDTHTRRLRLRIDQAQARYTDWKEKGQREKPQAALELLESIQKEAEGLGALVDFDITLEAVAIEREIYTVLQEREQQAHQSKRDQLLREAREKRAQIEGPGVLKTQPIERPDLEGILKLTQRIFKIPGYQEDSEAQILATWAQGALESFDRTRRAIDEAQERLRSRRFSDADYVLLGVASVSPWLKTKYEQNRELVRVLRQAETEQDKGAWQQSLTGYQKALDLDPDLGTLLEKDVARCQQHMFEIVQEGMTGALQKTPPDIQSARAKLEQAEQMKWIPSDLEHKHDGLRHWLMSQEKVAQAAALLQGNGEFDAARTLLDEARHLLPREQSDDGIRQWEMLLEVLTASARGDYREAQMRLEKLPAPMVDLPRVKALGTDLREGEKRSELIAATRERVQAALRARPAQYEEAIQMLQSELGVFESDAQVQALHRDVRQSLLAELESQRKAGGYAKAIKLGDHLLRLARHDTEVVALVKTLPHERREQLEAALQRTEEALAQYRISDGERELQYAADVVAPENDPRIDSLRRKLVDLDNMLSQLREELKQVNRLAGRQQWVEAVQQLLEIRRSAPVYEPVTTAVRDLEQRLIHSAETALKVGEFAQGIALCEQALALEQSQEARELFERVRAAQESALKDLRKTINENLDHWRLKPVATQLERGLEIAPQDPVLLESQERFRSMKSQLPVLNEAFLKGWAALLERKYSEATMAFQQAVTLERDLSEARLWRDYAKTMSTAVEAVEKKYAFESGARSLNEAESLVRLVDTTLVSDSLFGSEERLRENHRHAVYNAYRLRQSALKMAVLQQQADIYARAVEAESQAQGLALMDKVKEEHSAFVNLHANPLTPPGSFPAAGREDEPLPMMPEI
jgi:hypothetical protein